MHLHEYYGWSLSVMFTLQIEISEFNEVNIELFKKFHVLLDWRKWVEFFLEAFQKHFFY